MYYLELFCWKQQQMSAAWMIENNTISSKTLKYFVALLVQYYEWHLSHYIWYSFFFIKILISAAVVVESTGSLLFRIGYRTFFEIRLRTSTEDQGQFGHLGVCQLVILILSAKPIDSSHTKVIIVFFLSCVDLSQLLTPYTSCQGQAN